MKGICAKINQLAFSHLIECAVNAVIDDEEKKVTRWRSPLDAGTFSEQ